MIFKRLILYIAALIFITACYKFKEPEKPKNLISKTKMADILIDLKLINAANSTNKKIITNHNIEAENYIFSKYNVDSLQFALSNEYYAFHVEDYEDIYNKAKDSIEALKVFYEDIKLKQEELKKKKRDSIKRVKRVKDSLNRVKRTDSLKQVRRKKDSLNKLKKDKIKK